MSCALRPYCLAARARSASSWLSCARLGYRLLGLCHDGMLLVQLCLGLPDLLGSSLDLRG